ncbi:MAG: hypothetical protein Q4E65_08955 [Clostridia bacterium]|nr:hypothetical protein [Clostridia bacterium]
MLLSKRPIAFFLVLCMLLSCAPVWTRAQSWQDEHPGQTIDSDGFIDTEECAQFDLDTDRNYHFGNDSASFFRTWYLTTPYLNKLLSIGNYTDQCDLIGMTESISNGSCFGMASTMILNRLTKKNMLADEKKLHIETFYPAAQNYVDLPLPRSNLTVHDMINYYQIGQMIGSTVTPNTISADKLNGGFERQKLGLIVNRFKADIDADRPCLFSIATTEGGHAIVGVDYYEYSEGGEAYIILKLFDENCVKPGGPPPACWFSWIRLKKIDDDTYAPADSSGGSEQIQYHEFDGDDYPLAAIRYRDIVKMNETFNIYDPKSKPFTPTNAFLTVKDINNTYAQYALKPVTSLAGGALFGDASYVRSYGVFDVEKDGEFPCPVDVTDTSDFFPHMEADELQYEAISGAMPPFTPTNVRLSLHAAGEGARFAAYDVISSSGKMNISMSKTRDASGAGEYADVTGTDLQLARFMPDGTLRYLKGREGGQATDVSLYFGAKSMSGELDMLKLNMQSLGYLKLYSGADSPTYDGSVVLHSDGFPGDENAMDFTFYKGALISDAVSLGTAGETWVKIAAQPAGDTIHITVWTDDEPTADNRVALHDGTYGAPFTKPPVFTTVLHERDSSPAGIFDPDAYNSQNLYSANGGERLRYNGGDFAFAVNGPADKFVSVSIDGVMVERGFVTVAGGSIRIADAFMQTLKDGEHRLRVQYTDGYMQTTFVKRASLDVLPIAELPATGGAPTLPASVWLGILVLAVALFVAAVWIGKRK